MAITQPTKEQWEQIKEALTSFHSRVILKVDGYELSLLLQRIDTYKNGIVVYVNGEFKGTWLLNDCPERQRFLRPRVKAFFSKKNQASMVKLLGKRRAEKEGCFKTITYYDFIWTSFGSLKAHLIKNNESIELVKTGLAR